MIATGARETETFAAALSRQLGPAVRVRTAQDRTDADLLVVARPAWSCLWRWRSSTGKVLRDARVPVVIAASAPATPQTCLVVVRPEAFSEARLPGWLSSFRRVDVALSLDATSFAVSVMGTPFPAAFVGAAYGMSAARTQAEQVALRCIAHLGSARISHHVGALESTITEIARKRDVDVVFLADARELLFLGGLLRRLVESLGVSVIIPPRQSHAARERALAALP